MFLIGHAYIYIVRVKDFSQIWEESISSKNTNVCFNSKKRLKEAFFAKIKMDHRK